MIFRLQRWHRERLYWRGGRVGSVGSVGRGGSGGLLKARGCPSDVGELFLIGFLVDLQPSQLMVAMDWHEERGESMWGVEVDHVYCFETPTFYVVGEVEAVTGGSIRLKPGCCRVHWLNDMPTFFATGKFAREDEWFTVQQGVTLRAMLDGPFITDWPHPIPKGRSHPAVG